MASKIVLIIMLFSLFLSPATSRSFLGSIGRIAFKGVREVVEESTKAIIASCVRDFSNCTLTPTVGSVKDDEESEGITGYQVVIEIGEPPVLISGIFDTSSSLIWTQCEPCVPCFLQANPIFDPSESKTFLELPCDSPLCPSTSKSSCSNQCNYTEMYDENLYTEGVLATETFTFTINDSIPNIVFGCGYRNEGNFDNASGVIGFGRDMWSLPSQLRLDNFSYCLNSDLSLDRILLDSEADMNGNSLQSTPLLQNPNFPSLYYVNLTGISVDDELLSIPSTTFDLQPNGTGGLILDSLIFVTLLQREGYEPVKEALKSHVDLLVADGSTFGLDLCFSFSNTSQIPNIPSMTLHFDGGANMVLQWNEYMYILQDEPDGLLCLTFLPNDGISVLGNLQQVNKNIFFDIKNSMLSFQMANCSASG